MSNYYENRKALNDFKNRTVEDCKKAIEIAGLDKYEASKIIDEMGKGNKFDPYCLVANIELECKTLDEVSDYYKEFTDVLIEVKKEVHKRELAKVEAESQEKINKAKKQNEDLDKLNEQIKKDKNGLKKYSDEVKNDEGKDNDQPKSPPSPKEGQNPNLPKQDSYDDRVKREYIEETERELKKKGISDSQLNNALGVDDWRAEMNKSVGWRTAQTFNFSINDAIKKMSSQIVCDMCKETASPIIDYIVFDKKENKKKKFCSWECSSAWRDKNKGIDQDEAKEIKKEIKELKDYIRKSNENVNNVLNNLLSWVKKGGIVNIALSEDKLVVEFKNKETKTIRESDLDSEQRTLKSYLQNSSDKKSISRSELENMVGGNYNEDKGKNVNDKNNSNIGKIAAIVVVGLVLAVIIGVVVYKKNKKKRLLKFVILGAGVECILVPVPFCVYPFGRD